MKLTKEIIAELQLAAKFTLISRLAPHEANLWFRWEAGQVIVGASSGEVAIRITLPEDDIPPFTGDLGVASGKFIGAINSLPSGVEAEIVFTNKAIAVTAKPRTHRLMQVESSTDSFLFPSIPVIAGKEISIASSSHFSAQVMSGSCCAAGAKDGTRLMLGNTGFIFGIESTIRSTNGFILVSQPILETYPEQFEFQLNKRSTVLLSMLFKGREGVITVGGQRLRIESGSRVASISLSTNALPDFSPLFNQRSRSIVRLHSTDINAAVNAVRLGLDRVPKAYLAPEDGGFTISATSAEGEASEFLCADFEEWNEPKDKLCIQARMFAQAARFIEGSIRLEVTEQGNLSFSSTDVTTTSLKPKFVVSAMKE